MSLGLLFCVLGAVSFGLLGCVSKMAERRRCNSSAVVTWMICWATIFMLSRTLTQNPIVRLSWPVVGLAVGFGFCAVIAFVAFQMSIEIGK
jgi:drug/metabolite transporter (DMT)-like permease